MIFNTSKYTNKGSREINEDYALCDNRIWVLADGLGGHENGEIASKNVCDNVYNLLKNKQSTLSGTELLEVVLTANRMLIEMQNEKPQYASMRSTLVFAVTDGQKLFFNNVGDSRFYYFRNGKIYKQSKDHSVSAAAAYMGEIDYAQIRADENRNILLKVMGDNKELKLGNAYQHIDVLPGDAFLLCSDGFWEYVLEQEMIIDLLKSETSEEWLRHMVKRILNKTLNLENDNYTAVCVVVGE